MEWKPNGCRLRYFDKAATLNSPSSATKCLVESKVGILAGFGDSLGNEQVHNMRALLGGGLTWSLPLDFLGREKGYLVCDHWKYNYHLLEDQITLIACMRKHIRDKIIATRSSMKNIVLVTNFNIHHAFFNLSLASAVKHMHAQQLQYKLFREELKFQGYHLRLIWMSGVAVHGLRDPGGSPVLTLPRQEWINAQGRRIFVENGGWELLDVFNMTVTRPDATCDGVHYKGGVSKAITTVLLNMLCNRNG